MTTLYCRGWSLTKMLERAENSIRAYYVVTVHIPCKRASDLDSILRAFEYRFASRGRGTVTLTRPVGMPGIAELFINHTDIQSDSENDPQITY